MDWIRSRTYSEPPAHRKLPSGRFASGQQNRRETPSEWSGAQALSSKPTAASARILIIRFSGSIAFRRPGMRRIGPWARWKCSVRQCRAMPPTNSCAGGPRRSSPRSNASRNPPHLIRRAARWNGKTGKRAGMSRANEPRRNSNKSKILYIAAVPPGACPDCAGRRLPAGTVSAANLLPHANRGTEISNPNGVDRAPLLPIPVRIRICGTATGFPHFPGYGSPRSTSCPSPPRVHLNEVNSKRVYDTLSALVTSPTQRKRFDRRRLRRAPDPRHNQAAFAAAQQR